MSSIAPRFYVYVLARPDGTPFYVGKGQGDRIYAHEQAAARGVRGHRYSVIRKLWQQGGQVQRYIILTTDDPQEAFDYERDTIALYGRENLCNQTDGGDGTNGKTIEARQRIANALRGRKLPAATRAKMQAFQKTRYENPANRVIRSEQSRAMWAKTETRAAIVEGIKKQAATPEARAKRSVATRTWMAIPEKRERIVAHLDRIRDEPKRLEALREASRAPELLALRREQMKKQWEDPELRARRMAGMKGRKASEETRVKMRAAATAREAHKKAERDKC